MWRFTVFLVLVKSIFLVVDAMLPLLLAMSLVVDANLSSVEILKSVSIFAEVIIRGSFVSVTVIVDVVDDDWDWDVNGAVMCCGVGESGNKVWCARLWPSPLSSSVAFPNDDDFVMLILWWSVSASADVTMSGDGDNDDETHASLIGGK